MKKSAVILTATRGLGIKLAEHSSTFEIISKTIAITKKNIGESLYLPAEKTDLVIDVGHKPNLNMTVEPFDFLVWNTGTFLQKSFACTTEDEIDTLIDLHYRVPLKILQMLHNKQHQPYHLVVIASCSSWRMRKNEAIYCGLCAAKAAFARNFANDLSHELPGSRVTLFNPGGLRTPFFYEDKEVNDIDDYLNQDDLATFVWQTVTEQKQIFQEIQFLRNKSAATQDKKPIIEYGPRIPEII